MSQRPRPTPPSRELGDEFQDTITLLQEEIARLEEEIRLRDAAHVEHRPASLPSDHGLAQRTAERAAELSAELAHRDETIALLFEQIRVLEEAELAAREEWDQLEGWVREVEARVDARDEEDQSRRQLGVVYPAPTPAPTPIPALAPADAVDRREWEAERREWAVERRALEYEVERLRNRLEIVSRHAEANEAADEPDPGAGVGAPHPLVEENFRLRATVEELEKALAAAGDARAALTEVEALRARLAGVEADLDRAHDQILNERNEHEAALAALRSELAVSALARPEPPSPLPAADADADPTEAAGSLSTDERMWAFRSHLQEVYQRELEDRKNRRLSTRLNRLWTRTAPRN